MAQQFDFPETETQLREIQDKLYQHSKEAYDADGRPAFKGLLEIMSAETTLQQQSITSKAIMAVRLPV